MIPVFIINLERDTDRRQWIAEQLSKILNLKPVFINAGGERVPAIYTVPQSARLNGLYPEAYLANFIDRITKGHPFNRL
jgi:hypothetical protein